jgi:hypothetical protein
VFILTASTELVRVQCIIPEVNGLKKGAAIVVHKSIMRSVVKKTVYNDRIIAIKLLEETISILIKELYMPTSEHEHDEMDELYYITEEILEEDGKGETNTIIMEDRNTCTHIYIF